MWSGGQSRCCVALVLVETLVIHVSGRSQIDAERRKSESQVVYQRRVHARRRERPGSPFDVASSADVLDLLLVGGDDDDVITIHEGELSQGATSAPTLQTRCRRRSHLD